MSKFIRTKMVQYIVLEVYINENDFYDVTDIITETMHYDDMYPLTVDKNEFVELMDSFVKTEDNKQEALDVLKFIKSYPRLDEIDDIELYLADDAPKE